MGKSSRRWFRSNHVLPFGIAIFLTLFLLLTVFFSFLSRQELPEQFPVEPAATPTLGTERSSDFTLTLKSTDEKRILKESQDGQHNEIVPLEFRDVVLKKEGKQITLNKKSFWNIQYGISCDPDVPGISFRVGLPKGVDLQSVRIVPKPSSNLPTTIQLVKPILTLPTAKTIEEDGSIVTFPCQNDPVIHDGDQWYPADMISLVGNDTIKEDVRYVMVAVYPYQYNSVQQKLQITQTIQFRMHYTVPKSSRPAGKPKKLKKREQQETETLINPEEIDGESQSDTGLRAKTVLSLPGTSPGIYAVITTNAIANGSRTALDAFMNYKRSRGYTMHLVTETQWNGGPIPANPEQRGKLASNIRQWLINKWKSSEGLDYALLIGNPDPYDPNIPTRSAGEVPMMQCWPRRTAGVITPWASTDLYYAELTHNWNINNDAYFCDFYNGDRITDPLSSQHESGFFSPEILVGRIPVYSNKYTMVNAVLQRFIDYERATDTSWRKKAILTMNKLDSEILGWRVGESIHSRLINPNGFRTYRVYVDSTQVLASPDIKGVTKGHIFRAWLGRNNIFTNPTGVGILVFSSHNTTVQSILSDANTQTLDETKPTFAFIASCNQATPEISTNAATSLLKNQSVGVVAATKLGAYLQGSITDFCRTDSNAVFNDQLACRYSENLAQMDTTGEALRSIKSSIAQLVKSDVGWNNMFVYNLYGDPSLSLSSRQ